MATAATGTVSFVPNGGKPGRPRSETLTALRGMFPDYSERTLARQRRAYRLLHENGIPDDVKKRLIERCSRPNGSFNVAAFERAAEDVAAAHAVDLIGASDDDGRMGI